VTYYLGDRLVGNKYGSILQYAHVDHLGSLAARSDSAGNGAWRAYFPYGSLRVTSGSFAGDRSFTGQRLDIPTGMYFYGARYFDTTLGRFVSPDPTMPDPAQPTDLNRFAYVRNNPLRYIDPTGLYCTTADSWSLSGGRCTDPAFGSWQPANAVPESSPDGRPLSRGVQAPHFPIANDG
jgi:RHS repeat-associated protein